MPSKSPEQNRFMHVVYNMQNGKTPKSGQAGKAADSMTPEDVKDFLMQEYGFQKCNIESKRRLLKTLKEIQEPMNLQEEEVESSPNPIASAKTFHGDFKKTLGMYRGYELTPKENQAIQNFDDAEPTVHNKFKVGYNKSDDYGNTSLIMVKKLWEPLNLQEDVPSQNSSSDPAGRFIYVAIVKNRSGKDEPEPEPSPEPKSPPANEPPPAPPPPSLKEAEGGGDEIKIIKSVPIDDQEGSEILTNFLAAVFHKQT